jgi:prepilin-type N-terminal cleavage/methylation domain-containing protein
MKLRQHNPSTARRAAAGFSLARGFTLMEMLLALTVSAIALAGIGGVFFSAMRLRERTTVMLDEAGPLQQTLQRLKRDLQGATPPDVLAGDFKLGALGTGVGGTVGTGVGLQFSTTTGVLKEDCAWGDVQEVIYELREPAVRTRAGGRELIRSINRNQLTTGMWPPDEQFLMGNVEEFEVTCFDGTQWRDAWDTSLTDTNLPTAVRVRVMLAPEEGVDVRSLQPYEMVVPIVTQSRTNQTQSTTSTTTPGGAA